MRTKNGEEVSLIGCEGGCERLVHDAAQLVQAAANFPTRHDGDAWSTIHERHPFYRTNAMSFAEELTILPPFSARGAMLPERTRDLDGNVRRINTSAVRGGPPTVCDLPAQSLQQEGGGTRAPHKPPADVAEKLRRMQDMLRQEVTPTPETPPCKP